jgi:hypothetical protein
MADKKKPLTPKIMLPNRNPKKTAARTPMPKKSTPTPKVTAKPKPTPTPTKKASTKKVPAPMPTTKSGDINPFKMTPQQKQEYLRNPGRYSRG